MGAEWGIIPLHSLWKVFPGLNVKNMRHAIFLSYRCGKVVVPFCSSYTHSSTGTLFFMTRGFSGKVYLEREQQCKDLNLRHCFFCRVAYFFFLENITWFPGADLLCFHVGLKSQVLPLWRILFVSMVSCLNELVLKWGPCPCIVLWSSSVIILVTGNWVIKRYEDNM